MLYLLDPDSPNAPFPSVEQAEKEPNGLLAVGGDLSPDRLLNAYRSGVFPWYSDDQPILWWSPDPRTVLYPEQLRVSRSLRKTLRNKPFHVSFDRDFEVVMEACSQPRRQENGTWITRQMKHAYGELHRMGHAHSVEVWLDGSLVGGLYGVAIGQVFFGESMFSLERDASKCGFVRLVRQLIKWDFRMIDCQIHSNHLVSLGAREISRGLFCDHLNVWCGQDHWKSGFQYVDERN
ncbi:MAG: leucyl/phenylalanyl-tRNA--protein transferase [Gammaproteobacteria bacterium]|nr:leucyl/phenylalanyl-tRNA--protein transferase [Gammaproteobacteria bacterium]